LYAIVNNAGIANGSFVELTPVDIFKKVLQVNIVGAFLMTHYFLPLLRAERGRIVNITSIAGRLPLMGASSYCTSKYGLEGFSDSLRQELFPLGVKVIIIEPGFMKTAIIASGSSSSKKLISQSSPELTEVYQEHIQKIESSNPEKLAEDPQLTVQEIVNSLQEKYPKTRYATGKMAKYFFVPLSFLPSGISDLMFIVLGKLMKK